ncbi:GNAT superfamily N-acetyltransferase [Kribbella aluminosa]|uniref:GNAT superfamily N-acetyltransferase n=1 Tax=Kribbella aluminosa TaxID=416017 RepID=A0ABS4UQ78_9ACTN|nr:GNAT family N-acetyltransferase [Kribbella aluminosa]MBP2353795.1 GNAT superfamily N-acetyltransferase [Kribbella aluminosa]
MVIEGVELRAAAPTDPEVLALTAAQQAELAGMYGEDQPLVELHPDISFTVLSLDGTAAGCVGLQPVAAELGEIKRMYVAPSARGWGLSRLLLDAVESQARSGGLTTLRLETGQKQVEAIALYTNHGYRPTPPYPPFENSAASTCFAKDL